MALNNSKQSNLEIKGRTEREKELVKSDYKKGENGDNSTEYSEEHIDARSDSNNPSKILGKGTGNASHQAYTPNPSAEGYRYDSLNTRLEAGGAYDIHGRNNNGGRNRLVKINLYSSENEYSVNSIDTSANINDGQYVIKG
jgi:hypothetical protein